MAKVCIICSQEVAKGQAVADDAVIRFIRRVKQSLNIAKNNELVVCEKDLEVHKKKRQAYERNLAVYMVIAGIVLVLLVFLPIFTTGFSVPAILMGFLVASFLVIMPVLTSHTPALVSNMGAQKIQSVEKKAVDKNAMKRLQTTFLASQSKRSNIKKK